ncbi:glycosyltransferase family 4 protein [Garciella nitratireducens]|uniref:glycosyltransferase family 4 protein n=1 Tax=Garciella nitratireducens TaxID=218205 RepID=UPI000DE9084E|nr:glycosyltransferase family 4 protein [Garciella nitratireducens]RBP37823.1 glycosyltransferase involved in cell wall biosynthesis [Garciella nitratireducens]
MRILNINSYYFSSSIYKPMGEALLKKECDLTTYVPLSKNYEIREECQYDELPNYLDVINCYNKYDRIFFYLKHNKIKKDFLSRYQFYNYDLLHAHSLFSNGYIAYCAYKKYNIPYVVAVRNTDVNLFFKKIIYLRKLGIEILLNASKIIFLSEPYKEYCIERYIEMQDHLQIKNKSVVVPNGIDKFWLENKLKGPKRKNEECIRIIFVGAITKRKNLDTVLKSCKILHKKGYSIKFTVVGKAVDKNIMERLKKCNFVNLVDRVDREDLIYYYRQSDIFVMPSITETFGLVYPEAMSQGLPVIYTRGQGFDGQFNEGMVGYSVNCRDAVEISEKILKIEENYTDISNRCVKLVDKFNWDKIANKYIDIYNECIYSNIE